MLEFGELEQNIANQAKRMRKALPTNIANAPELEKGLELYLNAFFDLDSERPVAGMGGLARIPSSAVRAYRKEFELDEVQSEMLSEYISSMDAAYIKFQTAKNGKSS